MNPRSTFLSLVLLVAAGSSAISPARADTPTPANASPSAASTSVDLNQYRSGLRQVQAKLAGSPDQAAVRQMLRSVPSKYTVRNQGRDYEVDTDWLRNQLSQILVASKSDRDKRISDLRDQVRLRLADADALSRANPQFDANARQKAKDILAGTEFHRVSQPNVWQTWLQTQLNRFFRWLDRMTQKGSSVYWLGRVFIWGVIALACSALAIFLYRKLRQPRPIEAEREPIPFTASRKPWRAWLREAQEAAQRGDFREAVHCTYWAAISRLEEAGAWPADKTRTPREYLSFVKTSNPNHAGLLTLTRNFELIWYGNREAGRQHYEEARGKVEGLSTR